MAKKSSKRAAGRVVGKLKKTVDDFLREAEAAVGLSHLKPGNYEGFFVEDSCRIRVDKNGDKRAFLTLQVDDDNHPEYTEKERKESTNYNLCHEEGVKYFQGLMKLAELGHPNTEKEAAVCLEQLENQRCGFRVVKTDEYTNVYIDEVFVGAEEVVSDVESDAEPEGPDWAELGAAAEADDAEAQGQLLAAAETAGLDESQYSWEDLAAKLS